MTFPNLNQAKLIAVDIETHDPDLLDKGAGVRTNGEIVGVAVAVDTDEWYFPTAHHDSENIPLENVIHWLNTLADKDFVFANYMYDMDYLAHYGFRPTGFIFDVQIAEPLIDENAFSYALQRLGEKYLERGKAEDGMVDYAISRGWIKATSRNPEKTVKGMMKQFPAHIVAPYAKEDVRLTYDIFQKQIKQMETENLLDIFMLETKLARPLLKMKQTGVRLDLAKLEDETKATKHRVDLAQRNLDKMAGFEVNVNAAADIKKLWEKKGWPIVYTEKGNPSFASEVLDSVDYPEAKIIRSIKKDQKELSAFLLPYAEMQINGRLHPTHNQLRRDTGNGQGKFGTVTGRFSCSNPNTQQVTKKGILRNLFIPEEGKVWGKGDYSSVEPRILAHYGRGNGSDEMRARYNDDPNFDVYQYFGQYIFGDEYDRETHRKLMKTITLGVLYGMGKNKMAENMGVGIEKGIELIDDFNREIPFLKKTSYSVQDALQTRKRTDGIGWLKTNLGRKRRFSDSRFFYKGLNSLIQGSAADIMKKAMVDLWEAGLYNAVDMHLTVHDELDMSVDPGDAGLKQLAVIKEIMENCVKLRVPLVVEMESGPTWGSVKSI